MLRKEKVKDKTESKEKVEKATKEKKADGKAEKTAKEPKAPGSDLSLKSVQRGPRSQSEKERKRSESFGGVFKANSFDDLGQEEEGRRSVSRFSSFAWAERICACQRIRIHRAQSS